MEVIVGDYTAKKDSWLKELEELSHKRGDAGLLHSGCILWIQSYMSEKFEFILKAAIAPVLEAVPSIFPKDLPQKVEKCEIIDVSPKMIRFLNHLNEGLIIPIDPADIVNIIIAGQEYEKENEEEK